MSKAANPKAQGTKWNPVRIQESETSRIDDKVLRTRLPIYVRIGGNTYLVEPVGEDFTNWKLG